ncbi:MAG: hypothetical protein IKP58_02395 [Victivallales bacterium]|nr:hypothetical protein [Victivallales bacterium]
MKFVRFGSLALQKQIHYQEPTPDMWPCYPPCKKGFFAFPAGYMDPFYLPLSRPPEHPNSLLQYLRKNDGEKMTKHDLYSGNYNNSTLSEEGKAFLKKRHFSEKKLFWIDRPSYVMFCKDPNNYPSFYRLGTEEEDRSRLNQPLEFLLDPDDEKIDARYFFDLDFIYFHFPDNYEGAFKFPGPVPGKDFDLDNTFYCKDGKAITYAKWLKHKGICPEQLCIWPVYKELEDKFACILKKYHVFEYEGCLWHHLGELLKRNEILSQFSNTWYYTDIHAYECALKKSGGMTFWKKHKYQHQMNSIGYFGAYHWNTTFDQNGMYEVFFDQRIP